VPRLLRHLTVGLSVLVLLPVVLVVGALGLHWLGEVPDARALNAELERAQRVVAAHTVLVRSDPAEPRALTCCGDPGLMASATLSSDAEGAQTTQTLVADLRAAGWTVQQYGLPDDAPVVAQYGSASFSTYRSPADDPVQVTVSTAGHAAGGGTTVDLTVR
jgi:hypothetical protein